MPHLPADCLNEIFKYLEDDKITLHSCLLVNHIWCEVSVRFFWRNVRNIRTLIACLPNSSKEILFKNGIIISTPTSNPPMFNYATFCKDLSINNVYCKIKQFLEDEQPILILDQSLKHILAQEIFKLYFSQVGSLKKLTFLQYSDINFDFYPGAKDCLKNLSELSCNSNISSEIFYQLSQICQNILSLTLFYTEIVSKGLKDLISAQKNLKYLTINYNAGGRSLDDLIPLFTNPNNLSKLCFYGIRCTFVPFITKFTNLQELELSFGHCYFENFQHAKFPQLQVLKIQKYIYDDDLLIKFLENNGKNLKELDLKTHYDFNYNSLNLAIAKFCPNLRKLFIGIKNNELETLKIVFNSCQYLESIKILCGGKFLNETEALDMFVNYSNKNTYEIILYHNYNIKSKLLPEELESFFVSWTNRVPYRLLSLIIVNNNDKSLDANEDNLKIIEKYKKLGVVKKFEVKDFDYDFD
ncbi:hypothetical protein C1645_840412 [Glomus cerebriforme]|uniref:Uncharacterized protein n=1 Tax=Glomus cerebriforme TaxID=658196 RepID=A0A397RZB2_9GLOM|nr:hypothetical protein C1645_840412 [Glomus cerebriforme]